ncbi:Tomoregulin-2 [Oryzias melastigma]|uniref:Tomoregulin-2 n=1 Tax=Oryzias melastigma TaxID=30732 RepID=A0A834FQR4_ORYME|nr:Tomoregulin-2 [Oryzias melastigma]
MDGGCSFRRGYSDLRSALMCLWPFQETSKLRTMAMNTFHRPTTRWGENKEPKNGQARSDYIQCPEGYQNFCIHGECQLSTKKQPSCSCRSGYTGQKCETKEYNVLYVVPGSGKLRYVLIASIIGALQVAIISVVVLCITRKCPRTNRINRQKQNNVHFSSENTMRASTRLI